MAEIMHDALVFIGSYTNYDVLPHLPKGQIKGEGIYVYRWFANGKMVLLDECTVQLLNPAFMKVHPRLPVLYALTECINEEGYISAFNIDYRSGKLTPFGKLKMTGRSTCYISFDKNAHHAIITNYWDGKINIVSLDENGKPIAVVQEHQETNRKQYRQVVNREDHWSNRQVGPHCHCSVFDSQYHTVLVPDLGDNCIYRYHFENGKLIPRGFVPVAEGQGPRHFVFHPTLPRAYSGCELLNSVQVFELITDNGMCG
eukprot:TRINITY_DN883_c2_g1_i5.p1 TRINITY_DN883_c2_g1~~TRINITY_DN883_c2_g1_i5.p1  ORF type:complete len:264 (-),score=3.79 TRINITY_DN883_c2_g1_i5:569-1339(-)